MDEEKKNENHLTSAAAFVEGGIQEACDDACSICLEAFCDSDPSTITSCKHEFHLQCILEWCQRSSQCPMCWQPIGLKDPTSQELLEAVERERGFRLNQSRNTAIFHHPTLGDFELQHLPVGVNGAELEERIIQHLAAVAAMGRAHHNARREGQRGRSNTQRPHFLVFSAHPNASAVGPISTIPGHRGGESEGESESLPTVSTVNSTGPLTAVGEEPQLRITASTPGQVDQVHVSGTGPSVVTANMPVISTNRNSTGQSSPSSLDRAGPSEFQSFSESLKSRFNAVSMRYKESISKSTRGWKERLFSRHTSVTDLGSEVRREVSTGIAGVSHMMERLDTKENNVLHGMEGSSAPESSNQSIVESHGNTIANDSTTSASCAAASSGSN